MPRRKRPTSDSGREHASGARKTDRPFADLAALIRQTTSDGAGASQVDHAAVARGVAEPVGNEPSATTSDPVGDEELELFRRTVGDTLPLRDSGRTEIERPRPAPLPRTRAPVEPADAPARSARESDPLRAAYEGVIPLRDSGRVEVGPAPRRGKSAGSQPAREQTRNAAAEEVPMLMPADADQTDPSTLFRQVVGAARPVDTRNRVELERPSPAPAPVKREADERAALDESLAAPLSFEDRLDMGDEAAFLRTGLPRRVLTDLRRGRWVLQGQIDLHGLTRDEARDALARFLAASLQQGLRCIRVIHGKGLGSPGRVSILKQLSRGWLAQREEILAFCQAGPHDGGSGALLVLMRAQNAGRS